MQQKILNKKNIFFLFFINKIIDNSKFQTKENLLFFEKDKFNNIFKKNLNFNLTKLIWIFSINNFKSYFDIIKYYYNEILFFYYNNNLYEKFFLKKVDNLLNEKFKFSMYLNMKLNFFFNKYVKLIYILKKWI